ncbi:hypothetical protein [Marinobacter adhaerens]|nr:hypothetical protein [Marinobacter adhaerens]
MKRSFVQVDAELVANKEPALANIEKLHSKPVGEIGAGDVRVLRSILGQVNDSAAPHTGFVIPIRDCLTPALNSKRFKDRLQALSRLGVFEESIWHQEAYGRTYYLHRAEAIYDPNFHTRSYDTLTSFHHGRAERYPAKAKKTTQHFTKSNELFKELLMRPSGTSTRLPYRGLFFRALRLTTQESLTDDRIEETFQLSRETSITIKSHSYGSLMTLSDYRVMRALFVLMGSHAHESASNHLNSVEPRIVPTLELERILGYSYPGSKTSRRKVNEILARIRSTEFDISLSSNPTEAAYFRSLFGMEKDQEQFRLLTHFAPVGYARPRAKAASKTNEQVAHWALSLHPKFQEESTMAFHKRWLGLKRQAIEDNSSIGQCFFAFLEMYLASTPDPALTWTTKQFQTCMAPTYRIDRLEEGLTKSVAALRHFVNQHANIVNLRKSNIPVRVSLEPAKRYTDLRIVHYGKSHTIAHNPEMSPPARSPMSGNAF